VTTCVTAGGFAPWAQALLQLKPEMVSGCFNTGWGRVLPQRGTYGTEMEIGQPKPGVAALHRNPIRVHMKPL